MTRVTVVGLDGGPLVEGALQALSRASAVLGGSRHLAAVAHLLPPAARQVELAGDLVEALSSITGERTVVLASGDPGFFGIVRRLAAEGHELTVLPGVSSVAAAFARAGIPWDDAAVVSAHGRDPAPAVNVCRRLPKVAVLTSPDFGPAELAKALAGLARRLIVAEDLGTRQERITHVSLDEAAAQTWSDPNVVLVLDPDAGATAKGWLWPRRTTARGWALPDDAFEHRDGMITKAEVRALVLAWLGSGIGDLVWDVGAGTGSIAVESARLGAAAIAVEVDPVQCDRIRSNAVRHGVPVHVVTGKAPDALADLPSPDAVFVGGGGHLLTEIVRTAADRGPRCIVVALATVERVSGVQVALDEAGYEVQGTMLQASRLAELGSGHRLAALNPVFLVGGHRRDAQRGSLM